MILEEMKCWFECALGHDCARIHTKRCATCELDFKFIAENPVQLACGHTICWKCKFNQNENKAKCMRHGEAFVGLDTPICNFFINQNSSVLFQAMKEKFERTIDMLKSKQKINFCIFYFLLKMLS